MKKYCVDIIIRTEGPGGYIDDFRMRFDNNHLGILLCEVHARKWAKLHCYSLVKQAPGNPLINRNHRVYFASINPRLYPYPGYFIINQGIKARTGRK